MTLAPAGRGAQGGACGAHRLEGGGDAAGIGLREVRRLQRREWPGRHADRIVDQDVEPRQRGKEGADVLHVRDVERGTLHGMAIAAQRGFELGEPGVVSRIDDHMRPGGAQHARHGAAQMSRRGRYECDAPVEAKHVGKPPCLQNTHRGVNIALA
ncbi:MAG: hypothetical protein WDN03_11650 [Rhizomicrobium sp.]